MIATLSPKKTFQPTLPARGATHLRRSSGVRDGISTHAPRTGSDGSAEQLRPARGHFNPRSPHGERHRAVGGSVSTIGFQPTLPARGATKARCFPGVSFQISTHAPRTGSDPLPERTEYMILLFQPTLPARGATSGWTLALTSLVHFNPRSPHGERRVLGFTVKTPTISTHAPRTGSDKLSTYPRAAKTISTHAPRTGSD